MTEYIQAWQCIGCGKIEAPQQCIGVCKDRKVYLIGKGEHEQALAEIERLKAKLGKASERLLRFERAKPRKGHLEEGWQNLQAEVAELRSFLGE